MFVFGLAIFWGAFLLFLVQPLIAKFILPWFGGSAAVWTTCMLFFQVLLLAGYGYAHVLVSRLAARRQVFLHLGLLALALLFLPIQPGESWKPLDNTMPTGRILLLLGATLGLPYMVLSATGPLMQAWFSRAYPGVSPYRLYALSNIGSMLALISYPLLLERTFSRSAQAIAWSLGLVVFAGCATACGVILLKRSRYEAADAGEIAFSSEEAPRGREHRWLWFALPACASVLLLAVTNKICQDVAVIPFLWVLPLVVYLLSFIISFDSPRWYRRAFWAPAFVLALACVLWVMMGDTLEVPADRRLRWLVWLLAKGKNVPMQYEIAVYVGALFTSCMICHGEVYRLRPAARRLSGYYLLIAAGGAFGGLFVAVIAPVLFKNYFELHTGLLAICVLFAAVLFLDSGSRIQYGRPRWAWLLILAALASIGSGLYQNAAASARYSTEMSRSFYGVLKVYEWDTQSPRTHKVMLQHGGTTHGFQYVAEDKRRNPTTYYTSDSGIGLTMNAFPRQRARRVAFVGLGTGTLAAYGKPGDYFRFYEIDSNVERLARTRFSFLMNSAAKAEVARGDARLSMERETDEPFDIIVLDAFSSDAIPVHLLTREAFEIYRRRLKPDGVIAVHISNRYLNLEPIVLRVADAIGFGTAIISTDGAGSFDVEMSDAYTSDWILVSNNREFLSLPKIATAAREPAKDSPQVKMWTDDESSLLGIFDFGS